MEKFYLKISTIVKIIKNNDKIEIVHFIGGYIMKKDIFKIDKKVLKSRLIVRNRKI